MYKYLRNVTVLIVLMILVIMNAQAQGVLSPRYLRQDGATDGQRLCWSDSNGYWGPCSDSGSGVTSLNGLTGVTQTFADVDDTNVTVTISSTGTTHTWTLGWTSVLALGRGGTGADLSATGGANQFVKQSSAGAVFTVGTIADADVPNTITIDLASTATALASNPTDCSAGQYATAIAANGNLTCAQIAFSEISGSVTDSQVPNTITLDNITQITTRDHGSLSGLTDDDHTQYALLAGRATGQILIGGTASGDDLTLNTTSNVTKGSYFFTDLTSNGFMTTSGGTGVVSITSPNAGTDVTADLEEETHASEHQENGADELTVESLGTACTTGQHFTSDGAGGVDCTAAGGGVNVTEDTYANEPATCSEGDLFFPTDSPGLAGYCATTNTWRYRYYGHKTTLPLTTGWTQYNWGTSVVTHTRGVRHYFMDNAGGVAVRADCRTPPSAPYTIIAGFQVDITGSTDFDGDGTTASIGIGFKQTGATGNLVIMSQEATTTAAHKVNVAKWSDTSSFSAEYNVYGGIGVIVGNMGRPLRMFAIRNDNAGNILFYNTVDGTHFTQITSRAISDFLTAADEVCVFSYANSTSVNAVLATWEEQAGAP